MSISTDDPYLWLEEITDEKALDWVKGHNANTLKSYDKHPDFEILRAKLIDIYQSDKRIPGIAKRGEWFYNFWRDKVHIRGIWRRTTLEEYKKEEPLWEIVLDLDALAEEEKENWVWQGSTWLQPENDYCIIALSRGGSDASIRREFDPKTLKFVEDGFNLPECKSTLGWRDKDHIYVGTDFGPGSMTKSGYPRIIKLWERGTELSDAVTVFDGSEDDVGVSAGRDHTPGFVRDFIYRRPSFFTSEVFLLTETGLVKIDAPDHATKSALREDLLITLREPWTVGETTYEAGTLLITKFDEFIAGGRKMEVLFAPTPRSSLESWGNTKDYLYLNILEDVQNRIEIFRINDPERVRLPLKHVERNHSVHIDAFDEDENNDYFLTSNSFLTPLTLAVGTIEGELEPLKAAPAFFDASGMITEQHFATSADGTQVPYFIVRKTRCALDGNNPVILYGYGGFLSSLMPGYSAAVGTAWLEHGGIWVVANIRGGAEYGPKWHTAALKANRLRAYEDFAAVAKDLIARGITSPRRLGTYGGSNGGLLVGNMATMYPDLFHAIVCKVPLLDMLRYHKLLAGASWMEEYGDPDNEEDVKHLRVISPYYNVKAGVKYPKIFFMTSTLDDRVHPGHARKMVAKMCDQGHDVLYYENTEGGHGGAANTLQEMYVSSLVYTFFKRELFDESKMSDAIAESVD